MPISFPKEKSVRQPSFVINLQLGKETLDPSPDRGGVFQHDINKPLDLGVGQAIRNSNLRCPESADIEDARQTSRSMHKSIVNLTCH